jgi:hypothetical protein
MQPNAQTTIPAPNPPMIVGMSIALDSSLQVANQTGIATIVGTIIKAPVISGGPACHYWFTNRSGVCLN